MPVTLSLRTFIKSLDVRHRFYADLTRARRILDLGCGDGVNCVTLRALFPTLEIFGVDILEPDQAPDFVTYSKVDLNQAMLPHESNFFDAIIFTHVIEHLSAPLSLGPEINRVMKRGARIYVETPNWTTTLVPSFGFKREQHYPFNFYDDPTHLKPWSKHGLFEFLFRSCRLNVQRTGTVRNWLRIPLDFGIIPYGLITGNRRYVISSFWNLYGWCIYGVASKD